MVIALSGIFAILIVLVSCVSITLHYQDGCARAAAAEVQIASFRHALHAYRSDIGEFPTEVRGLYALRSDAGVRGWNGPHLRSDPPRDPWGVPYRYRLVRGEPEITSLGAHKEGGCATEGDRSPTGRF